MQCGYTGAGKTTFAKKFCKENGVIRLTHDEMMITLFGKDIPNEDFPVKAVSVIRLMESLTEQMLQRGKDVLIDVAGFKKEYRDSWKVIAQKYNAEYVIFHVDTPLQVALERSMGRAEKEKESTFILDKNLFFRLNKGLEPIEPDEIEFTKIIDGTK